MAWIEIHQELPEHPKTDALMDVIGCERPAAVGHVIMSLLWALRYAHDGVIIPKRLGAIARGAGWVADPDGFASAMVEAGWWDVFGEGWKLHDWDVYAGMLLAKREKDAARKRGDRGADNPKPVQRTSDGRPSDARMDGAGTNSTNQHDQPLHVSTDVDAPAKVAALTEELPDLDDVLDVVIPVAKAEGVTQDVPRRATPALPPRDTYPAEFEAFWKDYPRKVVKHGAAASWKRALAAGATAEAIRAGLDRWLGSVEWKDQELRHLPHATTWLTQRRWTDNPVPSSGIITIAAAPSSSRDRVIAWAHGLTAGRSPADKVSRLVDRAASADGVTVDREQALAVLAERGVDEALLWIYRQTQAGKTRSQEASNA